MLGAYQSGTSVVVPLAEPSRAGETHTYRVSYSGKALEWIQGNVFALVDTSRWYPHLGRLRRATYDVRLQWPRKFDLLGSGHVVDSGEEGKFRWERRLIERRGGDFSFTFGHFFYERSDVDGMPVTIGFARSQQQRIFNASTATKQVLASLSEALRRQREVFGELPVDELQVAVIARSFSQSFSGFVTLTDRIMLSPNARRGDELDYIRDVTIAHEVTHQWWGNAVGWWSYRDQWLSEAVAQYVALAHFSERTGDGDQVQARLSANWRDQLSNRTQEGDIVESLGPVVLGERLNSSRSQSAYRPIVYRKGGVILAMLARAVGRIERPSMSAFSPKRLIRRDVVSRRRRHGVAVFVAVAAALSGSTVPTIAAAQDFHCTLSRLIVVRGDPSQDLQAHGPTDASQVSDFTIADGRIVTSCAELFRIPGTGRCHERSADPLYAVTAIVEEEGDANRIANVLSLSFDSTSLYVSVTSTLFSVRIDPDASGAEASVFVRVWDGTCVERE